MAEVAVNMASMNGCELPETEATGSDRRKELITMIEINPMRRSR
jgi:hypothetical protein